MRRAVVVGALAMLAACGGGRGSAAQATDVAGTWVHREMPVRYLETMTLRTSGDRVAGEGTYMMEGGRAGKTRISGAWRAGVLTLRITRDGGVEESFTGRPDAPNHISGQIRVDGDPAQSFGLERQTAQP
jgi:hypothetical protein